jgi:hypothetical protein
LQRRVAPEKVLEYMSPFVRAGYNRAILDIEDWMYEKYKDVNYIPYMELADFMLKQMAEKKLISSEEVLKETVNKKPGMS